MALVPYTVTALAKSDADGTNGSNIVVGAVVSATDSNGDVVTLYDDATGSNPSTTKTTGVNGQAIIYMEQGEYTITVNGVESKIYTGIPNNGTTLDLINSTTEYNVNSVIETSGFYDHGDNGGAKWKQTGESGLTPSQTPSELGEAAIVSGTGKKWSLVGRHTARSFGAKGDGVSNDKNVWIAYLNTFSSAECLGLIGDVYGIDNTLSLPPVHTIKNAEFKNINPVINSRVLLSSPNVKSNLLGVTVHRGDDDEAGSMSDSAGIWIDGGEVVMESTEVTGKGFGNGIAIHNTTKALIDKTRVIDNKIGNSTANEITDDVFQGFWFNNDENTTITRSYTKNTKVEWSGQAETTRFNRGFSFGGSKQFAMSECFAVLVGQGFDYTGDQNTRQFEVTNCFAIDCYSWGFKSANTVNNGVFVNCKTIRCDLGGFVASAPPIALANPGNEITQNIKYIGCESIDTGSVGNWVGLANVCSFRTQSSTEYPNYPQGIQWIDCSSSGSTHKYGFLNDVTLTDGARLNEAINCDDSGAVEADFYGVNKGFITRKKTGSNQSIADATNTKIAFQTNEDYFSGAVNETDVIIRKKGTYNIRFVALIEGNASGVRRSSIYVNGIERTKEIGPGNASGITTRVDATLNLNVGDVVDARIYQDSGVALSVITDDTNLTIVEI